MSMLGRILGLIGKQRPLRCRNCGYRIQRDERVPRRMRGDDMGRRGWVHWTTFHEAIAPDGQEAGQ